MDIRYAAGVFDGDGWVRIQKYTPRNSRHVRYQVQCGLVNTYEALINQFKKKFGGSVRQPAGKPYWEWSVSSRLAASFSRKVLPHLIIKGEQIEIAMQCQQSIDRYKHQLGHRGEFPAHRKKEMAHRERLAKQLKKMKKQSYKQPSKKVRSREAQRIQLDIRYAAGLFDADGMVRIARRPRGRTHISYVVYCSLTNVVPITVELFEKRFGGSIHPNLSQRYNQNARPGWIWLCSNRVAHDYLIQVEKHLIAKKKQAKIALRLQANIDSYRFKLGNQFKQHPNRPQIMAYRERLCRQCSELKQPRA